MNNLYQKVIWENRTPTANLQLLTYLDTTTTDSLIMNGHVIAQNGHSTQNGHISQNGQSSQNGHSSRNGHSSQNGTVMKLFTPGPLETTISVREALLTDYGSRSDEMISIIKFIREKLVVFAGVTEDVYTCVPIQGSGTFAVEAVMNTTTDKKNSRVLIIDNGRYGERMEVMCNYMGVEFHGMREPESKPVTGETVRKFLEQDNNWDIVTIVHSETTTGVLNHVVDVGKVVKEICPDALYIVDSMSSFGAIELDLEAGLVDFMISSANKCVEGVPGFAYTICRKDSLLKCQGKATSLCFDLVQQYLGFQKNGMFRFTPPTHCLAAFKQALIELEEEGGVANRTKRYKKIHRALIDGMELLGFEQYIPESTQGCVVTCFKQPTNKNWDFKEFYQGLIDHGYVIYAGNTCNDCMTFRIGSMGRLTSKDVRQLLECVRKVLHNMAIEIPVM
ncbi:2-aminoethylphosphonate--pyruvate transaminase-like isoform X2 [Apostichopus japonicus]|uniref:2-aminoethylphosphonate--pyruvate transaminase-like isoform X2 n=1 Tax=Stichopus japonicus TaxID=307972 RepID=UPI003AB4FDFF